MPYVEGRILIPASSPFLDAVSARLDSRLSSAELIADVTISAACSEQEGRRSEISLVDNNSTLVSSCNLGSVQLEVNPTTTRSDGGGHFSVLAKACLPQAGNLHRTRVGASWRELVSLYLTGALVDWHTIYYLWLLSSLQDDLLQFLHLRPP